MPSAARAGGHIGHYLLLHSIGSGGMGVVYLAYDPRLDRRVALKILRNAELDAGGSTRARLLREARSLARLTHPNVVPVFDVGEAEGCAFVAMEYVEGATLGAWLKAKPRDTRAIVGIFVDAGRGLMAAHELGIVHRDFKPDNVLVGNDGRARVVDFGIARLDAAPNTSLGPSTPHPLDSAIDDALEITRAGTVLGTPAYMAPEQHRGHPPTPAADQYSFCVALFEALFARRPFEAASASALLKRKLAMQIEIPAGTNVPGWLQHVVLRGLANDPAARWPSLAKVVDQLVSGGAPRRIWWAGGASVVIVAGAIAVPGSSGPSCTGAERIAAVWGGQSASTIATAFDKTALPYARDTWTRASAGLDRFAAQWQAEHDATCMAIVDATTAEATVLDGRMQCLDARLDQFAALLEVLAQVDERGVSRSVAAVSELPTPATCREVPTTDRMPTGSGRRSRAVEIRRRLARVTALESAGQVSEAVEGARAVLADAKTLDHPPLTADAHCVYGSALERAGLYDEARPELREAVWQALAVGDDEVVARAGIDLVWLEGISDPHPEQADEWSRHVSAALAREPDAAMEAQLANALGAVHSAAGRVPEARAEFERALAAFERLAQGGQEPNVATALQNLGIALGEEGNLLAARKHLERALVMFEATLGPAHPDISDVLDALGGVSLRQGDHDAAERGFERALVIRRGALGERHPTVARSYNSLGSLYEAKGEYAAAEQAYRDALTVFEAALGDHALVAATLINLGSALERGDKADEAIIVLERALDMLARTAPDHPWSAHAQACLGRAELRRGRPEQAAAWLDRARPRCGTDVMLCGIIDATAARAVAQVGGDPQPLVARARESLEAAGSGAARDLDELNAWLAALPSK